MADPEFVEVPFAVPAGTGKVRLDVFLAGRLRGYSRAKVQSMIEEERVLLGRRSAKPAAKVFDGDTVVIRFPWRPDPESGHGRLEVLHQDDDVLAVNKPGDLLSHPTDKTTKASATWILGRQIPGFKPYLIHRLDRETSGILLFGRNQRAARRLSEQFESREVRKEYWALVRGAFRGARVVDRPIGRAGHAIRVRQSVSESGQSARTLFSCLVPGRKVSLVSAKPRTGRLHQIRVHLAWLGHPVVGDKLYTGEGEAYVKAWKGELSEEDAALLGAGRQMLHARSLEFRQPTTGVRVRLTAPLPPDFKAVMASFGLREPAV
ncbi:MAG: RluA family pseudouridine synthase [Elusimicrobia bacterium]|nr:RluA family pseudouridine synthase [Elusimicrobiota bacterium]